MEGFLFDRKFVMKKLKAIVLGATGATGQELVKLLLNDPNFSKVTIFVRKRPRIKHEKLTTCLLYTSPSPRDRQKSRMPSSA